MTTLPFLTRVRTYIQLFDKNFEKGLKIGTHHYSIRIGISATKCVETFRDKPMSAQRNFCEADWR